MTVDRVSFEKAYENIPVMEKTSLFLKSYLFVRISISFSDCNCHNKFFPPAHCVRFYVRKTNKSKHFFTVYETLPLVQASISVQPHISDIVRITSHMCRTITNRSRKSNSARKNNPHAHTLTVFLDLDFRATRNMCPSVCVCVCLCVHAPVNVCLSV